MIKFFKLIGPWFLRVLGFASIALPIAYASSGQLTSLLNGALSVLSSGSNYVTNLVSTSTDVFSDLLSSIFDAVSSNPWFQLALYCSSLDVFLSDVVSLLSGALAFFFWASYGVVCAVIVGSFAFAAYYIARYISKLLSQLGNADRFST